MASGSSAAQQTTQLLLVAGLATACCWAALTPSGQAWARRVWEGDREGARRRKAAKQLRFLEARLGELAGRVEVSVWVGVCMGVFGWVCLDGGGL